MLWVGCNSLLCSLDSTERTCLHRQTKTVPGINSSTKSTSFWREKEGGKLARHFNYSSPPKKSHQASTCASGPAQCGSRATETCSVWPGPSHGHNSCSCGLRMHKDAAVVIMTGCNFFFWRLLFSCDSSCPSPTEIQYRYPLAARRHLTPSFWCLAGTGFQSRVR